MTFKVKYTVFITATALFGFHGSVSGNELPQNFKLNSSDIRIYRAGDTLRYQSIIAGSDTAMAGYLTLSIGKTVTNPSGKPCLEHSVSSTLTGIGSATAISIRLLYYQDKAHSLYECGYYDNHSSSYVFITDSDNTPNGLSLSIKSPLTIGDTTSSLITYTDGSWKDCSRSVLSIEDVDTVNAVYESYKITETCSRNADNTNTTAQIWFVPALYTVKESGVSSLIAADFILDSFVLD